MKFYSDLDPPKRGTGKIIYNKLKLAGYEIRDLHYNANLWGKAKEDGWGTWACDLFEGSYFCGLKNGKVYLQMMHAPYGIFFV